MFSVICVTFFCLLSFFFFNDTATTEIYTLSLHDALPIYLPMKSPGPSTTESAPRSRRARRLDRKSTRLNSSHSSISYAVFCLKKKKKKNNTLITHTHKQNHKPHSLNKKTTPRPHTSLRTN